ncbi:MAG: helix-turn-helix domain-containing protein [Alphaproteobacteria bacterium]|nr:helix-turn-helix domain-containing protein [Alphaproteobacteria bacterium]
MSTDVKKTVGELLQAAREERGLSIESIAKDICIRSSYLAAIEQCDYKELPEKTFAVGFVRAYSMALKQDAKAIVEQFKEEFGIDAEPQVAVTEQTLAAPSRRLPGWLSPLAGVVGVSLCWALFGTSLVPFSFTADNEIVDRQTDVAQLQAVQAMLPARDETVVTAELALEETPEAVVDLAGQEEADKVKAFRGRTSLFSPAAIADQNTDEMGRADFTLRAIEDAWLRLENTDGTEIWSGVLREGQSYRPQIDGAALLSTSNAGGVAISFGGQELDNLGSRGEVVRDLKLDSGQLLSTASHASYDVTGSR